MKEVTILSFQCKDLRLQLVVKNNKTYLIKNRKVQNIDWPYRKDWSTSDKFYHSFMDEIGNFILNEVIWRIKDNGDFLLPDELNKYN